jgi:hypothetical protein
MSKFKCKDVAHRYGEGEGVADEAANHTNARQQHHAASSTPFTVREQGAVWT